MVDKNMISTLSHIRFDPSEPKPEYIEICDIAHALSLITRANGHFTQFYSVARHSINCAKEAAARSYSEKVQLLCLLHDAAEAYIGDMTRPLKKKIPYFSEVEKKYQDIIFPKFIGELSDGDIKLACSVDDSLLYHEFLTFNGEALFDEAPEINIDVKSGIKDIPETEREFLSTFERLKGRLNGYGKRKLL